MTGRWLTFNPGGPTDGPGEPHEWREHDQRIPIHDIPDWTDNAEERDR